MKLLYVSSVCTPKVFDYIFHSSFVKPGQAVQKFHRLIIEGLSCITSFCQVEALSSLPIAPCGHKRKFWFLPNEEWNNISFKYIPFINFPVIKHLFVFTVTFFKVLYWLFFNRNHKKVILCDFLNVSITWATFIACKLTRQPIAVIVTDLPEFLSSTEVSKSFKTKIFLKISSYVLHNFDYFIGLTQQMNAVVNPRNKPFMVMEGLVDRQIKLGEIDLTSTIEKKILLYAGGIYDKYGVKNLIEAFMMIDNNELELHIYGMGDLSERMPLYCELDERVKYFGEVNNDVIVKRLKETHLLINPRPSKEEFTKFSFPSKNMEYMVSGTPLLTTKLPGMPAEYYDYVYLFEDESIEGMKDTIEKVILKPAYELFQFGQKGQQFVLEFKSNEHQAKRIFNFLFEGHE